MKKKPEVTEKTRQTLIDVFCKLYSKKPVEKISVQEIAKKAGYNRSTFYQYFDDIYQMLNYIEKDVLDFFRKKMQENHHEPKFIVTLYKEKETQLNALLGDYGNNRFMERLKKSISPIEHAKLHGFDLPENDPIMPYLIEFHNSTSISLFRLWQRKQKDLALQELVNLMFRLYSEGIHAFIKQNKKDGFYEKEH